MAPKVVHISPMSFGNDGLWGGGERYPFELAQAMADLVPTRLVTFGSEAARRRVGPLEVVTLRSVGHWRGSRTNPVARGMLREIRGAPVVHAHHYRALPTNVILALGGRRGQKVFCTDHGGGGRDLSNLLRLHRRLTGFLAVSEYSVESLPHLRSRASVVFGGVNPSRFFPTDDARDGGALFVGRILPHKGIDVLIEAIGDRIPLTLLGRAYDPLYLSILIDMAQGRSVTFTHNASDDDVVAAYRRASVLVLPSVYQPRHGPVSRAPELLGLVLLEAMACGTPVVASAVGGVPEIVEEGQTGFLVPPGNVAALAERVQRLLTDSQAWERMSRAAALHIRERFTWVKVAERCINAYSAAGARH